VADNLRTILASILPRTAQKLHEYLGYEGQLFGTQQVVEDQEEPAANPEIVARWTAEQGGEFVLASTLTLADQRPARFQDRSSNVVTHKYRINIILT
jgi:hypothetical protein